MATKALCAGGNCFSDVSGRPECITVSTASHTVPRAPCMASKEPGDTVRNNRQLDFSLFDSERIQYKSPWERPSGISDCPAAILSALSRAQTFNFSR